MSDKANNTPVNQKSPDEGKANSSDQDKVAPINHGTPKTQAPAVEPAKTTETDKERKTA